MKYNLKFHNSVIKFLKKHPDVAAKIVGALEQIAQNSYDGNLDIKQMQGLENHYRLRIGKYRVLYEVIEDKILIYSYKADSRGDVYKK